MLFTNILFIQENKRFSKEGKLRTQITQTKTKASRQIKGDAKVESTT